MKLRNLIAVAAILTMASCGTTYQATDTGVVVVPDGTKRVFTEQYPGSQAVNWRYYDPNIMVLNDWEMTGWGVLDEKDYIVYFEMDAEKYYAWYDSDGTWVGTAAIVTDYSKLPWAVTNAVNTRYPSYTMTNVHREYYKDRMLYEITVKNDYSKSVLLVDGNGTIVKEKVKD